MFNPVDPNPNFPEKEKQRLDHWDKRKIVDCYLRKNKDSKKYFSFLDGPITANNPMGVHHAWGRTYKDLWQKFYNLLGYQERFQSGFDCQGLWVEVEVEKELGLRSKKDIENLVPGKKKESIAKFVELCKERVYTFSKIQTEQSKRLGYMMDWEHSYYTMDDENNYMIWHFLNMCYKNGWIYKGHESVPWCPRCETAISQHEMLTEDYKDVVHESIYLKLPIVGRKNENLLVWTTTPWTIPANIAVAVDTKLSYALVEGTTGDLFWVAKDLVEAVFKGKYKRIVKTVRGNELVGLKYQGPFDDLPAVAKVAKENQKFHTVIATDTMILSISITEGTGLVHTAVSAGVEDFKLGKKLGLPMIPVIMDNADYMDGLGFLSGKNAKKHPRLILDYLQEKNFVFEIHNYKHRYPACWRCKAELVWKVADEWYISMDKPGNPKSCLPAGKAEIRNSKKIRNSKSKTLRERMVGVAKQIHWMPGFGLERELDWLENMHDWLISKKNRYWGLALPIYECKKCGSFEVLGSKEELKIRAVSGWKSFEGHTPHKPFINEVSIQCKTCKEKIKRINDVGSPWLDAGIVGYSTIRKNNKGKPLYLVDKKEWKKWFPATFITESFPGQFKNWFYSLIAMSAVLEDTTQFKNVLGYASCLGEDGRPMHKSWGNAIEFNEAADKIGIDVMRWVFIRQNPEENLLFGYKKTDTTRRHFFLMLWNIYKFFIEYANLDNVKSQITNIKKKPNEAPHERNPSEVKLSLTKGDNILDIWILNRLYWLTDYIRARLIAYDAQSAAVEIEKFISDISTWYIRRSRDRVWVNSEDKADKISFYRTLHHVLTDLTIIISPFIPFISDEMYVNLTGNESVHLSEWPIVEQTIDTNLIEDMALVRKIAEAGHRTRKENSLKVRQALFSAAVSLPKSLRFAKNTFLESYLRLLKAELNVKKITIDNTSGDEEIRVVYDMRLTKELIHEGKLRELIRTIQVERKKLGTKPDTRVTVTVPQEFAGDISYIRKKVLAKKIEIGDILKVL